MTLRCMKSLSLSLILTLCLAGSFHLKYPESDINRSLPAHSPDLQVFDGQRPAPPKSIAYLNTNEELNLYDFPLLAEHEDVEGVTLVINEFMASNSGYVQDSQGQYDDWIEIYNFGSNPINVSGMYLTDNLLVPTKWRFPDNNPSATIVSAGGYLLIWADEDTADAGLHANFKLNAGGEQIALFDSDGVTVIDSVVYGEQTTDTSYGRYPDAGDDWLLFSIPSPKTENISVFRGIVSGVEVSHERGFYDTPFSLTLASETNGAVIYYTLDGTEPYEFRSQIPKGMPYIAPVTISGTTCLRAVAAKPGFEPSDIMTQTYIFPGDVIRQSPLGQRPGPTWPAGSVNGQIFDYGMDPDVVNNPRYSAQIRDALLAIPSISLVTNPDNMFDRSKGIYVNAGREGRSWERPVSAELINPDDSEGFQIDAGIRIRGAWSRTSNNPKHSFRLTFRGEYGQSKLRFPMFGDEGVDEFDNIDLRTAQNWTWSNNGANDGRRNTFIRDVYARDLSREMGRPYTRSRYYHLYLNGQYWGLYQSQERAEASYAESYFGGEKEDYDVIKTESYQTSYTDGSMDAWNALWYLCQDGFESDAQYYAVQGKRPDGTDDPAMPVHVDTENLIDYMLDIIFTGNRDAPVTLGGNRSNNFFAIRSRKPDVRQGWKFFVYDSEHSMLSTGDDRTAQVSAGQSRNHFNPQWLHQKLMVHPEYRMHFADRAHKYFFNDGIMIPENAAALCMARANEIDLAIIAESARWGDHRSDSGRTNNPYTKADWWSEVNGYLINTFFPARSQIVLGQLKNRALYPQADAPVFRINGTYKHGGLISVNAMLSMTGTGGTIWYTLDGSDPRLPGTVSEVTEKSTLIPENASKRVLVPTANIGNLWKEAQAFDDSAWDLCAGGPGGVGYERSSGYQQLISLDIEEKMYAKHTTCYIRIPFTDGDGSDIFDFMTLKVKYDDGFIAYLNGTEVARRNFSGTPAWNSNAGTTHSDSAAVGFESIDISAFLDNLQPGGNLLAIHGLNVSTSSSDLLFSVELIAGQGAAAGAGGISPNATRYTGSITLDNSTHVKARVLSGNTWSALNEAVYAVGPAAENLRISEIMYNPPEPNEEFIELKNIGTETINLNLISFTNGIDFIFPNIDLAAGEYTVVVRNRNIFEARYGTNVNIAGQYSGSLNNAGERIELNDAVGNTIHNFRYRDGWRSITDGDGFSLTIIDAENPDLNSWDEKDSWRPSAYAGGSPGFDDSGIIPNPGAIVINEVLAHSHAEAADWIELYNTTGTAIDIGGWFISESGDNLFKYEIANGTTIGPNGYLVLYEDLNFGNESDPASHEPFALSENGERLYLSSAQNGEMTGYRVTEDFGASETGVSFGRYYKSSTGNYNFVAMEENTPGSVNSYPKVGPIVISEIMYNPDWPNSGSYTNDQYEYIELHNISAEPVTLYDYVTGEPWKFTDGVDFTFGADVPVTIPAGGYILIVKNQAAFSLRYPSVPVEIILGPYDGNLSNAGESLELNMPGDVDNEGIRQYIRADRINYSDGSHPENCPGGIDLWPTEADGNGMALTRKIPTDYGNAPENWTASDPSPGE